ncbi:hypothetical protein ABT369_46765 [Dactylosporangium sp. NPDC000244]|uniref:hypothetical protein n=1 Tax=Dactylosporangium sp. NPDC000244 TaxID=3154365 RepID=UPI0033326205
MGDEVLDPILAETLGSAANALHDWGRQRGLRYELDRPLTHGRSGAVVALVYVTDAAARHTRKLLLKLDVFPDGPASEFQRQRAALDEAPPPFARRHLARLAPRGDDLVPVGDGRWFVFQEIAGSGDEPDGGGRLDELDVLTKALAAARAGGTLAATGAGTDDPVRCDAAAFVDACAEVTRAVLDDWAVAAEVASLTAAEYVERHLLGRARPGKALHTLAARIGDAPIRIDGEREVLPNPFAALAAGRPGGDRRVRALLGRCHGDLHAGNILVPMVQPVSPLPFRLVDLAKYETAGPLARDPAGLLLYVIVRTLPDLPPAQRGSLIEVVADPGTGHGLMLPGWLPDLVARIRDAGERFANRAGLLPEWRAQWPLSLAAAALILLARATTPADAKLWLLRLAGRATAVHLGPGPDLAAATTGEPRVVTTQTVGGLVAPKETSPGRTWVASFCQLRTYLEEHAGDDGHGAVLALREAAEAGEDRHAEYLEFVRSVGGPELTLRGPGDDPTPDVVYACPMRRPCDRVVRPGRPGDPPPYCALRSGGMRREFR